MTNTSKMLVYEYQINIARSVGVLASGKGEMNLEEIQSRRHSTSNKGNGKEQGGESCQNGLTKRNKIMKEEQFLKELKTKGFDYSKPVCVTHYGDSLCLRSAKLALVKGYKVTTASITYWVRFSDTLDEHIFGIEIEGFAGPDAETAASAFAEVLNSLSLKEKGVKP